MTTPLPPLFEAALVVHGLAVRQTLRGNIHPNGGPHEWVEAGVANDMPKPVTPLVRNIAQRLIEVFPSLRGAQTRPAGRVSWTSRRSGDHRACL